LQTAHCQLYNKPFHFPLIKVVDKVFIVKLMLRVFFLSILLFSFLPKGNGQSNHLSLSWSAPTTILDSLGKAKTVLHFTEAVYNPGNGYWPFFSHQIDGNVSAFSIQNPLYAPLTDAEQKLIGNDTLNEGISIKIGYQYGKPISFISFIPLKLNSGTLEKLISFDYTYTTQNISALSLARRQAITASSSVLSSGTWYKISIQNSGVFKMDYSFLQSMGINPASIDPRQIKIYGNGGGMLPQANSTARPDDLAENPIFVYGESDSTFNTGDYVLFYGQGPDTWTYNKQDSLFMQTKNLYSDEAFYFVTLGPGMGKRIQAKGNAGTATQTAFSSFDDRFFLEPENVNVLKSGREWYGDIFSSNETISYEQFKNISNITANSKIRITARLMANSSHSANPISPSFFSISANNSFLGNISIPGISTIGGGFTLKGYEVSPQTYSFNSSIASGGVSINLAYNQNGNSSALGYLNSLTLNIPRNLDMNNGTQWSFRVIKSLKAKISEYSISNAGSNLMIWEVTNPVAPIMQNYTLAGTQASFTADSTMLREFVAFTEGSASGLSYEGRVPNQNLHGINSPDLPDMVIVTHGSFSSAAEKLAAFRKTNDNLDVLVVTTDQVYNEFSSGSQDVTAIRDFMRLLYTKKIPHVDSVRFLLLFGDCSYDYKSRVSNNTNFVPVYESRSSLDPLTTYSSEDYFGLLDSLEGTWSEPAGLIELMDIGIGRIPCKSAAEADGAVNKIMHYHTSLSCLGKWRNKICIVSDDEETSGGFTGFMYDADSIAKGIIEKKYHHYNVSKIYMDAYIQTSTPDGEVAPQVNEAISEEIQKGVFTLNYVGHGGETQWAQENVLNMTEIIKWDNYDKLPFLVTATCDFGRYDDPSLVSGGEYVVVSDHNGGIGILTSTRPVFQNTNFLIYKNFYTYALSPIAGKMPRLGNIINKTKNSSVSGTNNRNYALLGDPSMMLEYPEDSVVITKINNIPITGDSIKAQALGKVNFEGEIRNASGAKLTGYNGILNVTVYDQPSTFHTVTSLNANFKTMNNFIYEGRASVKNGDFSVTFIVPKDISYQNNFGKVSFYADENQSTNDASGNFSRIFIGGTSSAFTPDNTPPVIKLYMQDSSFIFGGVTNSNTSLIARLSDASGINLSIGGIGHEITGILDNGSDVIILNDYYSADIDNYTKGTLTFPLKGLSPGNHSMRVKAWDTYNNSSESYIEFVVANDENMAIQHVLNYPNPFSTHTNFHFDHNRGGDDIEVLVSIYTISGKLIKTIDDHFYASNSHISDINWDGRDDFGDKIGKGVYIYKLNVRSLRDGSNNFKYQKLVILN
jgi:hypothetical protein